MAPVPRATTLRPPPVRRHRPAARPVPAPAEALAHTGEYSIFGLVRPGDQTVLRERRVNFALIIFAIATVVAVIYATERCLTRYIAGEPVGLAQLMPAELVVTYLWVLLTPLAMWMSRRFPVWGATASTRVAFTVRNWAAQLAGAVLFSVLHVLLFTGVTVLTGSAAGGEPARQFTAYLASWFTVNSIVYLAFVAAFHALVYYRVSQDRALRASQLEARLAQTQLQMLRMQLQPHFLFNTLHTISALMHRDVKRADSMIAALSDLLRLSLRTATTQEVSLREEVEFLQRYLEIMRLRFGDRLAVHVDVDPRALDARVPTLVLQPLVENALRHGFDDGVRGGTIAITITRVGDAIRCDIVDDGRGFTGSTPREGIGLGNTRARLRQLYGERGALEVTRAHPVHGGVRVSLLLPFHPLERTAAD